MQMNKPELLINTAGKIAEGICWDEDSGMLYWIDLLENKIFAFNDGKNTLKIIDTGQNTGCIRVRERGGLIAGLQNGIYFVDIESGRLTLITDPENDRKDNRFNDGSCDCKGRFWAGTMSKALDSGAGDLTPRGALYCMETDFSVKRKISPVTISNGLGFSPDNSTMYYIDSPTNEVAAYDYHSGTAEIGNKRAAVKVAEETGMPDGLTVDSEGMLWVAMWRGGAVVRYDPADGREIGRIELPVKSVTATAFGGENMDDLFITTARIETDLNKYPDAGGIFRVRVGVKGRPAYKFKG